MSPALDTMECSRYILVCVMSTGGQTAFTAAPPLFAWGTSGGEKSNGKAIESISIHTVSRLARRQPPVGREGRKIEDCPAV